MGTSDGRPRFDWQTASTNGSSASTTSRDAVGCRRVGERLRDAGREPRGAIRRGGEPESRGRRPGRPRLRTPAVGDVRAGHRAARGRAAERALLVDQRRARAVHPAEQRLDEPQPASRARRVRARRHALHRDDDDGHLRRPALPDPGGGMEVERKDGSDEVPFPAMGGAAGTTRRSRSTRRTCGSRSRSSSSR